MTFPRQPAIPRATRRACDQTLAWLPRESAPIWVHLGAMAAHARLVGLTCATGLRDALADVDQLHATLDLSAFASGMTAEDEQHVEALWVEHPLPDTAHWYGYAIGDLYQALSSEAREARALCQTPYWVSDLLFEVAYRRARETWSMPNVIDPSCGTGHILVEALDRKLSMSSPKVALSQVSGVDLDPYAAMVARYRLLVLAGVRRGFQGASEWPVCIGVADSLLDEHPLLERGQYQVVVANPPYIVPKEAKQRDAIRARYREVCTGKYSLALPFTVLMTELAVEGGYIAQLTTNAWMKREYGKHFVERYLPRYELVWIINSAGAYIPGHGTPTCILVHRNLPATGKPALAILSKRGEPSTPEDPAEGVVWRSVREQVYEQEAWERFQRGSERFVARHAAEREEA